MPAHIRCETEQGVAVVTISYPERFNAMSRAMWRELKSVFETIQNRPDLRCVRVVGEGAHFCAGGDLKDMAGARGKASSGGDPDAIAKVNRRFGELCAAFANSLRVVARAFDAVHEMDLVDAHVHHVQREVLESSLRSARATLELLGFDRLHARELADEFRRYTDPFITSARDSRHDDDDLGQRVREAREQFEKQMQADLQRQHRHRPETGWTTTGSAPDQAARLSQVPPAPSTSPAASPSTSP